MINAATKKDQLRIEKKIHPKKKKKGKKKG